MSENGENTGTNLPKSKAQLMARIQNVWNALDQMVSQLTEDQLNLRGGGTWSIKDNLAHLASWEEFMILCYLQKHPAYQAMQIDEEAFRQMDEDATNEVLFQRHRGQSSTDVLKFYRDTHHKVLDTLDKMTFDELMKPYNANDPKARPVILWVIGNTYDHYQEHQVNIKKILSRV